MPKVPLLPRFEGPSRAVTLGGSGCATMPGVPTLSPYVRRNRETWDAMSEWYQDKHGAQLKGRPLAWGVWAISESRVNALGEIAGKTVLELGCGGGQWSMHLANAAARPVGIDLSGQQLRAARRLVGTMFPLVHGDGEALPFRDASFDLVISDYGAMSWADPYRTVPEVARVLKTGGRLAFNTNTPWVRVCQPDADSRPSDRLLNPYFGLHRTDEGDGGATFTLGYGDWIRLFRRSGLDVEDYIELSPEQDATSAYDPVAIEWAKHWPAEAVWVTSRRLR